MPNYGRITKRMCKSEEIICTVYFQRTKKNGNVQRNNGMFIDVMGLEVEELCATNDGSVRILESTALTSSYAEDEGVVPEMEDGVSGDGPAYQELGGK